MSPINIRQVREMAASEKADSERQPESGADQVVYTVGHSNHTMEHLISILKAHHIEVLIDIRTKPYSLKLDNEIRRTAGFTLKSLTNVNSAKLENEANENV